MISEGKVVGSLDMVQQTLVIERFPQMSKMETTVVGVKPPKVWYLAPLFLGLLGGLIGYVAVKDEDRNMATDLLWLGIAVSMIGILVIWLTYAYWWSILFRFF